MSRLKVNEGAMDNAESVYSAARLRYSQSLYWLADCFIYGPANDKNFKIFEWLGGTAQPFF